MLATVRGTVQADILKEDQGQNTCIFSTDFALKLMGDVQEYFIWNNVRNFYSVSISGYHIAEAGANPISQLAFTLANGFTYVEAYLARGMNIDDFAPNLSFFFSNGMDPEYAVIGRVARRIWAIAMKHRYGANERSQKLKYHMQTSGRSLHAQDMAFNDIRTTLQALLGVYDNANSMHTNAYDEAVTTPTAESVRRAVAIQLILNREWGLAKNENPNQGAFIIEELTDLVEEAVLREFDAIAARGGVLGAMETGYQRTKIQDELLLLRTEEARRQPADHRRQHLPRQRGRRARLARTDALDRRGEALAGHAPARIRSAPCGESDAAADAPQTSGDQERKHLRRADGRGPLVLARPDHQCAVRGRRSISPQHVAERRSNQPWKQSISINIRRRQKPRRYRCPPLRHIMRDAGNDDAARRDMRLSCHDRNSPQSVPAIRGPRHTTRPTPASPARVGERRDRAPRRPCAAPRARHRDCRTCGRRHRPRA